MYNLQQLKKSCEELLGASVVQLYS